MKPNIKIFDSMKFHFNSIISVISAALAIVSCKPVDITKTGVLPEMTEISLNCNEDDIRPGQRIEASIVIPTGGQNILSEEHSWTLDDNPTHFTTDFDPNSMAGALFPNIYKVAEADGNAYFSFSCPEEGPHMVSYSIRYNWAGLTDGTSYKDVTIPKEFNIVKCDIFSSKWGDNLEKTQDIYSIEKMKDQDNVYGGIFSDVLSASSTKTISRYFAFENNLLARIDEYESGDASRPYSKFLLLHKYVPKRLGFEYSAEESYRNEPGTPLFVDNSDTETLASENAAMAEGALTVHAVYRSITTKMVIEAGKINDKYFYQRTYISDYTGPAEPEEPSEPEEPGDPEDPEQPSDSDQPKE